jgi:hypothetical protein
MHSRDAHGGVFLTEEKETLFFCKVGKKREKRKSLPPHEYFYFTRETYSSPLRLGQCLTC